MERLLAWQVDRLFELRREWRASVIEYERTTIEGIDMLRVFVTSPDPKQEQDGRYGFLVSPGASVQLGAAPSDAPDHLHDPFDPAQDTVWLGALGHSPQPDGRCLHRWKNRAEHVVRCAFLDGYRAALSRPSDAPEKP